MNDPGRARLADEELDDHIDYDAIHASTQPDEDAGRFAFNSEEYPTDEAASEALRTLIHTICEGALREVAAGTAVRTEGRERR